MTDLFEHLARAFNEQLAGTTPPTPIPANQQPPMPLPVWPQREGQEL